MYHIYLHKHYIEHPWVNSTLFLINLDFNFFKIEIFTPSESAADEVVRSSINSFD